MKKILLALTSFFILISTSYSYDLVMSGVFYNSGNLDNPESLQVKVTFFPGSVDTTYKFAATPAVWDTAFTRTDAYTSAYLSYTVWFGTDSVKAEDGWRQLQNDSINYAGFFTKIGNTNWASATRTLTSFSGVGTEVWANPIKSLTDKANFTLSSSEVTNIATNVKTTMEVDGGYLWSLVYFLGAVDGATVVLYPPDGTSPKDSAVIVRAGVPEMVVRYKHSNSAGILDSIQVIKY